MAMAADADASTDLLPAEAEAEAEKEPLSGDSSASADAGVEAEARLARTTAARPRFSRPAAAIGLAMLSVLAASALVAGRKSAWWKRAPAKAAAEDLKEGTIDLFSVMDQVSSVAKQVGVMTPPDPMKGQQMDLMAYAEELNQTTFNRRLSQEQKARPGLECIPRAIATASYFAFAGLNVDTAAQVCGSNGAIGEGHYQQMSCAISAQYAAAAFAWAGYFLAGTIDSCSGGTLKGAGCATASMELLAALLTTSAAGTSAAQSCKEEEDINLRQLRNSSASMRDLAPQLAKFRQSGAWPMASADGRRLQFAPGYFVPGSPQQQAYCAFDIIFTINWLVSAALSITSLVVTNTCAYKEHEAAQLTCASLILRTIASFSFTASYISSAVMDCGNELNLKAMCAADVSEMVGGVSLMAAAGVDIQSRCVLEAKREQEAQEKPLEYDPGVSGDAGR